MALEYYGYFCTMKGMPFAAVREKVVAALTKEGFGVHAEIDVGETLKQGLGSEFRNYLILAALNPSLTQRVLEAEPHAGLLLAFNVVLQDRMGAEGVVVSLQNPGAVSTLAENLELADIAHEADVRLLRVLAALGGEIPEERRRLEDVKPLHPGEYPGKGMKARLDARRALLAEINDHHTSLGLEVGK